MRTCSIRPCIILHLLFPGDCESFAMKTNALKTMPRALHFEIKCHFVTVTFRHDTITIYEFICSTMRGRIKGTDSTINAILATAVLYELRWKIWNGVE